MRPQLIRLCPGFVAFALLAGAPSVLAGEADALPPSVANAMAQASPQAIMDYRRKLQEYEEARTAFEQDAGAYWGAIADKRRGRNAKRRDRVQITLDDYVLQQPPVYEGPKRPVNPAPEEEGGKPPRPPKTIPVVSDLIRAAAEQFQFTPQRPSSEVEFKRAYARYARAAGLTPEQAVRVYSFETGGTGNYDVQAGIEHGGKRAISTAMGYNQLLTTNTVELLAEQGHEFVRDLTERVARTQGPARKAMEHKLAVLKKMVAFTRTVPDDWSAHQRLADTPQGWACHAMVLDIDIGPMLQTHKLLTSVIFARNKGYGRPLTAAELEMMNLTGDGTGFDMVTMPQAMREQVPTANFFQRSGYERNPVAIRHNTVARLLAVTNERMDVNSNKPGARELAGAF
ncbi:hypothetical protein JQ559_28985 [Bradyrhizobium viridifuturi]|jgi:hypothetical protein|nr:MULTISPECIES: hypothetical protein [Bradyrhizobium]ERF84136.1 MAG: branched-chain amino acid transport system ATP-binding protein [Bradyrhizobium sp. DFCI-1]OYU59380.1 MAG: hypothetical protein CFE30_25965 [Bradyrhizobium sp. PARBB1]PSO25277.1 hypothetical protein C7G43_16085 [Bradyrhizobium sp. MOS004]QRI70520.1 hypothetical protein JQ507_02990 [Bradyrhizobium sp. PSBB068]MBR1023310.1 hypothetical protein [Bradyrhizobium viridifuturi]